MVYHLKVHRYASRGHTLLINHSKCKLINLVRGAGGPTPLDCSVTKMQVHKSTLRDKGMCDA